MSHLGSDSVSTHKSMKVLDYSGVVTYLTFMPFLKLQITFHLVGHDLLLHGQMSYQ